MHAAGGDHVWCDKGAAALLDGEGGGPGSATSAEDRQRIPAINFSFAMGGWLMFYSFGVAKCLLDHGLHKVSEKQSAIGSSAGSLAAAALILEADIDKVSTGTTRLSELFFASCNHVVRLVS